MKAHDSNIDQTKIDRSIQKRVKMAGSSFYWAMRLMPKIKRKAMYAIYAFCREVDDIADGQSSEQEKRTELSNWRQEIENTFLGRPNTLIGYALLPHLTTYSLFKQDLLDVIDGMEMDAPDKLQISDMEELELYCDKVACSVGRLSNQIFGLERTLGLKLASSLGQALQLTNILRDVYEDLFRGKVYLPETMLREDNRDFNQTKSDTWHPALSNTCKKIAVITKSKFDESTQILSSCNKQDVRPAIIMMVLYKKLFEKLCHNGWNHHSNLVSISPMEKMLLILKEFSSR